MKDKKQYHKPTMRLEPPKCRACKWSCEILGDTHLECMHPETQHLVKGDAIVHDKLASVGRVSVYPNVRAEKQLGIVADQIGIAKGWFDWPMNFDPTWLKQCNGFQFGD